MAHGLYKKVLYKKQKWISIQIKWNKLIANIALAHFPHLTRCTSHIYQNHLPLHLDIVITNLIALVIFSSTEM